MRSDIVAVRAFFVEPPWLIFDHTGGGQVDGVKITLYLEGAGKPKGVFGAGTIVVTMYGVEKDAGGRLVRTQIHEWELPPEKAYPWRSIRESRFGWGYGLRLHWDPSLDVAGKEVVFVVKYVHEDGRVNATRPKAFRVPITGTHTVGVG